MKTQQLRSSTKMFKVSLLSLLVVLVCGGSGYAQSQFADLVQEGDAEWMLGTWTAQVDGEDVVLTYKWELEKNLISIKLTTPEFKYQGLIIFRAAAEEVIQVGADTLGNSTKGTWKEEYGSHILTQTTTNSWGYTEVTRFKHMQVDKDTMRINVEAVKNTGYSQLYPTTQIEFKRKK